MVGLQTRGEWAGAFRKCCIELGISYMMAVKEWLITVPPLEAERCVDRKSPHVAEPSFSLCAGKNG